MSTTTRSRRSLMPGESMVELEEFVANHGTFSPRRMSVSLCLTVLFAAMNDEFECALLEPGDAVSGSGGFRVD